MKLQHFYSLLYQTYQTEEDNTAQFYSFDIINLVCCFFSLFAIGFQFFHYFKTPYNKKNPGFRMIFLLQVSNFMYSLFWSIFLMIYLIGGRNYFIQNDTFSCQFSGFMDILCIMSSFTNLGVIIWMMKSFLINQNTKVFQGKYIIKLAGISYGSSIIISIIPLAFSLFVENLPWDCTFDKNSTAGKIYFILFEVLPFFALIIWAIMLHTSIRKEIKIKQDHGDFIIMDLKQQGFVLLWYTLSCFSTWFLIILYDIIIIFVSPSNNEQSTDVDGWKIFRIVGDCFFQLTGFLITISYFYFVNRQMSLHCVNRNRDSIMEEDIKPYEPLIKKKSSTDYQNDQKKSIDNQNDNFDPLYIDEQGNVQIKPMPVKKKSSDKSKKKHKKSDKEIGNYLKQKRINDYYESSAPSDLEYEKLSIDTIQNSEKIKIKQEKTKKNNDKNKHKHKKKDINPLAKFQDQIEFKDEI